MIKSVKNRAKTRSKRCFSVKKCLLFVIILVFGAVLFLAGAGGGYLNNRNIERWVRHHAPAGVLEKEEMAKSLFARARKKIATGDLDAAIALFHQALEEDPRIARVHLELGFIYDKSKADYIRAVYHYERYLEMRPQTEKKELVGDLIGKARGKVSGSSFVVGGLLKEKKEQKATEPQKATREPQRTRAQQTTNNKSLITNPKFKTLSVNMGSGVKMDFVWIEVLKSWVGKYEVTNKHYRQYKPAHDSGVYKGMTLNKEAQPVVNVTLSDAKGFCGWLNQKFSKISSPEASERDGAVPQGYKVRLPSEKEWKRFAGCGEWLRYPWGDEWAPPRAWNYRGVECSSAEVRIQESGGRRQEAVKKEENATDNSQTTRIKDSFIVACPVEQSGMNAWGLYGVGGNVWEWCGEWVDFDEVEFLSKGMEKGEVFHVLKGGSWFNYSPRVLETSFRALKSDGSKDISTGFRVVLAKVK